MLGAQPILSTTASLLVVPRSARADVLAVGGARDRRRSRARRDRDSASSSSSILGTGYALGCALFWGLSTVAGRIVMLELSLPLAAGLRVIIGLACMTLPIVGRARIFQRRRSLCPRRRTPTSRARPSCGWSCSRRSSGAVPPRDLFPRPRPDTRLDRRLLLR